MSRREVQEKAILFGGLLAPYMAQMNIDAADESLFYAALLSFIAGDMSAAVGVDETVLQLNDVIRATKGAERARWMLSQ